MTTTGKRILVSTLGWLFVLAGIGIMILGLYLGAMVPAAGLASIASHEKEGTWLCLGGAALSLISAFAAYKIDRRLRGPLPRQRLSVRYIVDILGISTLLLSGALLFFAGVLMQFGVSVELQVRAVGLFILPPVCCIWLVIWLDRYLRAPVRASWKLGDSDKWIKE
jgi:hypothetical protein